MENNHDIEREIEKLAYNLHIENCEGCRFDDNTEKKHTCLDQYYYQLAHTQALYEIEAKYNISLDFDFYRRKHSMRI